MNPGWNIDINGEDWTGNIGPGKNICATRLKIHPIHRYRNQDTDSTNRIFRNKRKKSVNHERENAFAAKVIKG